MDRPHRESAAAVRLIESISCFVPEGRVAEVEGFRPGDRADRRVQVQVVGSAPIQESPPLCRQSEAADGEGQRRRSQPCFHDHTRGNVEISQHPKRSPSLTFGRRFQRDRAPVARQLDVLASSLGRSVAVIKHRCRATPGTTKPAVLGGFRLTKRRGRDLNPRRA